MPTSNVRPQAVHITERAAWAQIQKLQRVAFDKAGLPGVIELNELLRRNYHAIASNGPDAGDASLLVRGMVASVFITDLLPQIEQEITGHAVLDLLATSSSRTVLASVASNDAA